MYHHLAGKFPVVAGQVFDACWDSRLADLICSAIGGLIGWSGVFDGLVACGMLREGLRSQDVSAPLILATAEASA
jgi:hypothetical protein